MSLRVPGTKCRLCFDELMDPTSTRCGHIFCKHCITSHITNCVQELPIECPECFELSTNMLLELTPVHIPVDGDFIAQLQHANVSLQGHTKALATRVHSSAQQENITKKRAAAQIEEYKQERHHWRKKYNTLKRTVSERLGEPLSPYVSPTPSPKKRGTDDMLFGDREGSPTPSSPRKRRTLAVGPSPLHDRIVERGTSDATRVNVVQMSPHGRIAGAGSDQGDRAIAFEDHVFLPLQAKPEDGLVREGDRDEGEGGDADADGETDAGDDNDEAEVTALTTTTATTEHAARDDFAGVTGVPGDVDDFLNTSDVTGLLNAADLAIGNIAAADITVTNDDVAALLGATHPSIETDVVDGVEHIQTAGVDAGNTVAAVPDIPPKRTFPQPGVSGMESIMSAFCSTGMIPIYHKEESVSVTTMSGLGSPASMLMSYERHSSVMSLSLPSTRGAL